MKSRMLALLCVAVLTPKAQAMFLAGYRLQDGVDRGHDFIKAREALQAHKDENSEFNKAHNTFRSSSKQFKRTFTAYKGDENARRKLEQAVRHLVGLELTPALGDKAAKKIPEWGSKIPVPERAELFKVEHVTPIAPKARDFAQAWCEVMDVPVYQAQTRTKKAFKDAAIGYVNAERDLAKRKVRYDALYAELEKIDKKAARKLIEWRNKELIVLED